MISILLATYNGEKYIGQMLDSLQNQTLQDFKVYIHDDESEDDTLKIIKEWICEKNKQDQFFILEGKRLGSAKDNFFWLLENVESDYYMFADQDDIWLPLKIETTFSKFNDIKKGMENLPICIFSDMKVVDENLDTISDSFIRHINRDPKDLRYQRILVENMAAGCTMLINRALREYALLPKNKDSIEMHDRYFAVIAALMGKIYCIDEPLVLYRQHQSNVRGAESESVVKKIFRNIREILSRKAIDKKKKDRQIGKDLAKIISNFDCKMDDMDREIIRTFSDIDRLGKIKRIRFYKRYGFNKAKNNFWYLLWV